jgi:hypothetical protein
MAGDADEFRRGRQVGVTTARPADLELISRRDSPAG